MNRPKYLVAKYIPDMLRMEPRNIGVIVLPGNGTVEARFTAENPTRAGDVDNSKVPSFVTSRSAYCQWIQFWRWELEKPDVRQFLMRDPTLLSWNRGNFVLVEGGFLLDPAYGEGGSTGMLAAVADSLYRTLVETQAPQ